MDRKALEKLTQISRGFQPAKVLLTACELDLFDHLERAATAAEAARATQCDERALAILLGALTALGLVHKEAGRYRNGEAVSEYLVRGKPDYRGAIFRHMNNTWSGWTDLTATVRQGMAREDEHQRPPGEMRSFILGMDAIARDLAPKIAPMLPLPGDGRLLDVGGGPGTYTVAFCRRQPKLRATLFDRPGTIEIAREQLESVGRDVAPRVTFQPGDFISDSLGAGYDFVWMSHILHSYTEAQAAATVRKGFEALNPGGVAAVHEFALNDNKTGPLPAALFSVHMLAVTQGGRAYSREEIAGWMRQAGFRGVRARRATPATSLVIGRKP